MERAIQVQWSPSSVNDGRYVERQNASCICRIPNVHVQDHAMILTYTCNRSGGDDVTVEKFEKAADGNENSEQVIWTRFLGLVFCDLLTQPATHCEP